MPASVISIGNFDGVHLGHAALIRRARLLADQLGASALALAFDPHPAVTLRPRSVPPRLTSFDQRAAVMQRLGAHAVERLDPSPELLALTPDAFIARIVERYTPTAFVEGPDFRFGSGRAGSVDTLAALGRSAGFQVHIVDPVTIDLEDQSVVTASSTICRWLIAQGRVRDAARVLGRPYELAGLVTQGDRRGRTIGFPTANLATDQLLPADGVYAARATLPDGRTLPAAVNVGPRPTFGVAARAVEAHLINAPNAADASPAITGLPEYHWPLRLELIAWIRDVLPFAGVDALTAQLHRDIRRALQLLNPEHAA